MKVDHFLLSPGLGQVEQEARRAESIGFDGFFTADTAHDPFLPLVTAARVTGRMDLGTGIAVAFARSPMTVAYTSWDLADASGGRFLLGLGTQIRAHVTRRFSMPWEAPAARLAEYIRALRAIWYSWQNGSRLSFTGEYYSFTLMTPFFDPGPIAHPSIPIYVSAVNPLVTRLAGELCQGIHVHPFHTARYVREVMIPEIQRGAAKAGRSADEVALAAAVFVVSGETPREREAAEAYVRQQIAFYASTPAYRRVLDHHGWSFGEKLTAMSKRGEWGEMASVIPDEVVEEVAVVAPLAEVGSAIRRRYEGLLERVALYTVPGFGGLSDGEWAELVSSIAGPR